MSDTDTPAHDHSDRYDGGAPDLERWLVTFPLVTAMGLVIAFLLGLLVAVVINGG